MKALRQKTGNELIHLHAVQAPGGSEVPGFAIQFSMAYIA